MEFKNGETVRVTTKNSAFEGRTGKVSNVAEDGTVSVDIEGAVVGGAGFFASELEPVEVWEIELSGEDSVSATLELTEAEARIVQRVVDALQPVAGYGAYAPSIEMKRKGA